MTKWFKPLGQDEWFLLRVTSSYTLLNELVPTPGGFPYIQLIIVLCSTHPCGWQDSIEKLVRIAKKDYFTVQETVLPLQLYTHEGCYPVD